METQVVTIAASDINLYSTIMRACITASNACVKLHDADHYQAFCELKEWASDCYDTAVTMQLTTTPAKG